MPKLLLFLLAITFSFLTNAQHSLQGQIIDEKNNPLAFVNILVNGNNQHVAITDIDGKFTLKDIEIYDELHLSYVGFQSLVYTVLAKNIKETVIIPMKSDNYQFEEITVFAGENPAHRIIRKVIAHRNENDPRKYSKYRCQMYNKTRFGIEMNIDKYEKEVLEGRKKPLSRRKQKYDKQLRDYQKYASQRYLAISETVTDKQYIAPNHHKQIIIHNKVSGFERPDFATLAEDAQPFSFYASEVKIFQDKFINPISKGSTKIYYFDLAETLINGQDTIFVIHYQPKKGKTFEALKGVLYIHSKKYAIQSIIAERADSMLSMRRIEQRYTFHEKAQKWFPEQLNMECVMSGDPKQYMNFRIEGKGYISDVDFEPNIDIKDFTTTKYQMNEDAFELDSAGWNEVRAAPLSTKELATYPFMDSLSKRYRAEKVYQIMKVITAGNIALGPVDLDMNRLLLTNLYEGTRLGIGLNTNDRISKHIQLGGYVGYGFQDEKYKYGGFAKWYHSKDQRAYLKVGYENELRSPAKLNLPRWEFQFQYNSFLDDFYQPILDNIEHFYIDYRTPFLKYGMVQARLTRQSIQSNIGYEYAHETATFDVFDFDEFEIKMRYAYGEQVISFMDTERFLPTRFPIIHMNIASGIWRNINTSYHKIVFGIEQEVSLRQFGTFNYSVEAGQIIGEVPLTKLFASIGIREGASYIPFSNAFQTMFPNEFLSDRFAHLFFQYQTSRLTKRFSFTRPYLGVVHHQGWGSLRNVNNHNIDFKTLEKGFFETGVEVYDLLIINVNKTFNYGFGVGGYLRHGAYELDDFNSNFAYRMTLNIDF